MILERTLLSNIVKALMIYIVIETENVLEEIKKNLTSDHFVLIKSKKIYRIHQFPFSNIICVPYHLTDAMVQLLETHYSRFKSIKKNDVKLIMIYITDNQQLISYNSI